MSFRERSFSTVGSADASGYRARGSYEPEEVEAS